MTNAASRTVALTLALTVFGCSSDDANKKGDSTPDAGGGGTGAGGSGTGASIGNGGSGKDGATESGASCGDIPILGDFWTNTSADCAACIEENCCAERSACSADADCSAYRSCLSACDQFDPACSATCTSQHPPGTANSAFATCRSKNCAACTDTSCAGTAWPAPTTAHDITMNATLKNFATSGSIAGATVKVCAHSDLSCSTPLDQGTTKSDGTITLKLPAAAGGTDAYLELTGSEIEPEDTYLHYLGGDTVYSNITLPALDLATARAFGALAGEIQADAGAPDAAAPDAGAGAYGSLTVLAHSCENGPVLGATISSSNAGPAAVTTYLAGGVPSKTATATDSGSMGAIVNHALGATTVTVKLGTKILGTASINVRPGVLTTIAIPPGQ